MHGLFRVERVGGFLLVSHGDGGDEGRIQPAYTQSRRRRRRTSYVVVSAPYHSRFTFHVHTNTLAILYSLLLDQLKLTA